MSKNTFFTLEIRDLPWDQEEMVSAICFDFGAQGISEILPMVDEDTPEPAMAEKKNLEVYFAEKPEPDLMGRLSPYVLPTQIQVKENENKDWMEEWKKGFHAFELVDGFWVVPSWESPPVEARSSLLIDPGMAFGTGTHETTQLAAKVLVQVHKDVESMLDVGTGTAILAILADQLEVHKIDCTEIDPEARRVARENCEHNNTQAVRILNQQVEELDQQYDLVVANIIDGVLIEIQKDLIKCLKPSGKIILSGIIQERDKTFCNEFLENYDFAAVQRYEKGDWVAYLCEAKK